MPYGVTTFLGGSFSDQSRVLCALFRMHVPKSMHPFSTPFLAKPTQVSTFVSTIN